MTYQEQADHIAELIEAQLGIRGKGLERKMRKAGRMLPRSMHNQARMILDATRLEHSPKLSRQIDGDRVSKAFGILEKYLSEVDPWDRRKGKIIAFLTTNAFNLIAITAILIFVLLWRGFL